MPDLPIHNLDLAAIALRLEGLEETIIYHLIERIQFLRNSIVYTAGKSGFDGEPDRSLLDIRLLYHEKMDSAFGRFAVPEERPFTPGLPEPRRKVNLPDYPIVLEDFNSINLTSKIKHAYIDLLPEICQEGDDGQYGSSVEHDVYALQAISRRIHFGALFVAESKYQDNPDLFRKMTNASDQTGIIKALTREEVERKIISRVREKMEIVQSTANPEIRVLIDPDLVVRFYKDTVIPLTKEGELLYLLSRCRS
ncbi:MAG: chorismate mutase [Spirochaetaceae bacterium]|nr:MAG: chorismate mutase [Spirochaetaceae bacterium]